MGTCPTSPELCIVVAEDRRGVSQGAGHWEQKYWVWFRLEEKQGGAVDAGDSHLLSLPRVFQALHLFEPKMQLLALPSELWGVCTGEPNGPDIIYREVRKACKRGVNTGAQKGSCLFSKLSVQA